MFLLLFEAEQSSVYILFPLIKKVKRIRSPFLTVIVMNAVCVRVHTRYDQTLDKWKLNPVFAGILLLSHLPTDRKVQQ